MVHCKVVTVPYSIPVTRVVGDVGVANVAVPLTTDHIPVPITGATAITVVNESQLSWLNPALATASPVISIQKLSSLGAGSDTTCT